MATVNRVHLKIDHDRRNKKATVTVSYRAHLSSVERNMTGLLFREAIKLWGEDSPDSDDDLYNFPTRYFNKESNGSISRTRTVTIGEEVLDEDGFPRPGDEIYARVSIRPQLPTSSNGKSNTVHGNF